MASAQSVNYTRARPMWNKIDLISQMFKTNRLISNVQVLSIIIFFSFFLFFPILTFNCFIFVLIGVFETVTHLSIIIHNYAYFL